jgi:hypothetical protein
MRKLFFIFLFFIFSLTSLDAYSKKIIMISFSSKTKAQLMMKSLKKKNPSLFKLSKKYKFSIKMRRSGKYYILVAEPFKDKKILKKALKSIRKDFKSAYVNNYTEVKKTATKVVENKKPILKKTLESIEKNSVVKTTKVLKEKKEQVVVEKSKKQLETKSKEPLGNSLLEAQRIEQLVMDNFKKYFHWSYIVILIFLGVLIHYYIKFKRIYDEY